MSPTEIRRMSQDEFLAKVIEIVRTKSEREATKLLTPMVGAMGSRELAEMLSRPPTFCAGCDDVVPARFGVFPLRYICEQQAKRDALKEELRRELQSNSAEQRP